MFLTVKTLSSGKQKSILGADVLTICEKTRRGKHFSISSNKNLQHMARSNLHLLHCRSELTSRSDSLLTRSAAIYQLQEAPIRHRQSVVNHIWNDGRLQRQDREYILHVDDLVYLNPDTESSWVHVFVRSLLSRAGRRVMVRRFRGRQVHSR